MAAFPVDGLDACIVGNQHVNLALYRNSFCIQGFLNALADNAADSKFLQTELLKYQIDFMRDINSSSYTAH